MFDGGVAVEAADPYDEQDHVLVRIPLSAVHSSSYGFAFLSYIATEIKYWTLKASDRFRYQVDV